MGALFKNTEVKRYSVQFFLIGFILFSILFGFLYRNVQRINETIIKQNIGAMGVIAKAYPELEGQLAENYIKGYEKNYTYGKEILKKYSYYPDIDPGKNTAFKAIYKDYLNYCLGSFILLILLLYGVGLFYLHVLFTRIRQFQDAAQRIVEGSFSKTFHRFQEGDLYILAHQFNQMSDRLREHIEALKVEKERLKDFISDITHQLKTPLASLIMFNELMTSDLDMPREERKEFLSIGKNQLERIEWLIKNLLKMGRLEAGAVIFNKVRGPIYNTILTALEGIQISAKLKQIEIRIEGNKESLFTHDIDWTAEALSNIIKNSIEHSQQGSEINISYEETPLSLQIIIEDKGEGIREEEQPKIFERFYKGESSTNPMSIGIGLYITKTIIEAHGGTIIVYSKEGAGTKFVITFIKTVI